LYAHKKYQLDIPLLAYIKQHGFQVNYFDLLNHSLRHNDVEKYLYCSENLNWKAIERHATHQLVWDIIKYGKDDLIFATLNDCFLKRRYYPHCYRNTEDAGEFSFDFGKELVSSNNVALLEYCLGRGYTINAYSRKRFLCFGDTVNRLVSRSKSVEMTSLLLESLRAPLPDAALPGPELRTGVSII